MKYILGILAIGLIFTTSCKKDIEQPGSDSTLEQPASTSELTVASGFDWKTTFKVHVSVQSASQGVLYIKSLDEKTVYHKGMVRAGNEYHVDLTLPTTERQLVFVLGGQEKKADVAGDLLSIHF